MFSTPQTSANDTSAHAVQPRAGGPGAELHQPDRIALVSAGDARQLLRHRHPLRRQQPRGAPGHGRHLLRHGPDAGLQPVQLQYVAADLQPGATAAAATPAATAARAPRKSSSSRPTAPRTPPPRPTSSTTAPTSPITRSATTAPIPAASEYPTNVTRLQRQRLPRSPRRSTASARNWPPRLPPAATAPPAARC